MTGWFRHFPNIKKYLHNERMSENMEYQHGGDIYSHPVKLDYSANINPLGLPEGVKKALANGIETCSPYPDSSCGRLRQALSAFHRVSPDAILCGNGAADLIFQLVLAARPKRALLLDPSFLEYEQALKLTECEIIHMELKEDDGFAVSVPKLCQRIDALPGGPPDLFFFCNPNNPTGLAIEKEELKTLAQYCRANGILFVVDECFNEFLDEPQRYSVLDMVRQESYENAFENVFVLKAFTKTYAMAGLRLGYGICSNKTLLGEMETVRQPWSVSSLAQMAGEAALKETDYVCASRKLIARERESVKRRMREMGFYVYDSMANYLFFRVPEGQCEIPQVSKESRGWLYDACLQRGILIRSCYNYRGLDNRYYRICIKTKAENEHFLAVLKSIMEERR